ncbi:MAG TPA: P-loop NTPase fold protein [Kiritimatiellia bacterium]|nr:P-loop NTPase fold protein [Kiritimatiellia bacterium]HMP33958.1 P-loop NTPase fold protein [Kiritimatiellia bacterium]
MWSDNETSDDLFGFRVHADLIRELIIDPAVLPATIGVYGDWGGGKSSIMQMLRDDFEKETAGENAEANPYKGVAVLYFNGWLFEGYDDAKAALLSSILTALRDHKRFGPKLKESAGKLLNRVDYMRAVRMLFTGAVAGGVAAATGGVGLAAILPALSTGAWAGTKDSAPDAIKDALENGAETNPDEALSDIRQFRDDFAKMLAESDIKTLVVLIDDLDRCSPDRIIENLEAIKLFLNVPNTAFVIGADRRIIRQAVAWRYRDTLKASTDGQSDSSERLVDDYLEKLIQIPYRLPRLSPSEIETYLTLLFCKRHLEPALFSRVCEESRNQRAKDRYCAFTQTNALEALKNATLPPKLSEALRIGAGIASQVTDVLQGNPRQVKRFLNAFFLRRKLADVAKLDEVKDEVLVKLMLLEYAAPKLFDKLFANMDGQTGLVGILAELEPKPQSKPGATPSAPTEGLAEWAPMTRWLALQPPLATIDLRDYMWVTRDRLGSTMSGTTMVPPIVRAIFRNVLSEMGDAAGRKAIHQLQPAERSILTQLLVANAQRTPGDMKAFRALMEIADIDTQVADEFKAVVSRIPSRELSPALGIDIVTMSAKSSPLGKVCQSIVAERQDGKTPFEKALKQKAR